MAAGASEGGIGVTVRAERTVEQKQEAMLLYRGDEKRS
jgi:hypothetical protein